MWATPDDIKSRWISGKTLPPDAKLSVFIDDVEAQILNRFPLIGQRITDGGLPLQIVRSSIARIVTEFLLTDGSPYAEESQSYNGVGSRTIKQHSAARKSLLLTDADFLIFAPVEGNAGVLSVTMNTSRTGSSYDYLRILHA